MAWLILILIQWEVSDYHQWAEGYYERDIDLGCLKQLFDNNITMPILQKLNSEIDIDAIEEVLIETGLKP